MNIEELGEEVKGFRKETKDSFGKIFDKLDNHSERITRSEEEIKHVSSIQTVCRKDLSARALQVRGKAMDIFVKVLVMIIIAGLACLAGAALAGCNIEKVKQMPELSGQASLEIKPIYIDDCKEYEIEPNPKIIKGLDDIVLFQGPIKTYMGPSEAQPIYDVDKDYTPLVAEAQVQANEARKLTDAINKLIYTVNNFFPWSLEDILAFFETMKQILMYGIPSLLAVKYGAKPAGRGVKKIGQKVVAKIRKNGNDGNKS